MGFHFAHLIVYDQSFKTALPRESVIAEVIRHAVTIVRVAIDTTDDLTRHLSDHIYHMITFAAFIICRLLNMFEAQVASYHDVQELDTLVRDAAGWQQSIGLRCHAAYMLGNAVAKVQRKLRPSLNAEAQVEMPIEPWLMENFPNYFPDFLGVETATDGTWDLLPSWTESPNPLRES